MLSFDVSRDQIQLHSLTKIDFIMWIDLKL